MFKLKIQHICPAQSLTTFRTDRLQPGVKISPREVARQLHAGSPTIELNPATGSTEGSAGMPSDPNKIVVGVWALEPGEDLIVGRRLRRSWQWRHSADRFDILPGSIDAKNLLQ